MVIYTSPESAEALGELGREGARWVEGLARRALLDPATRPLPPYDCPTGTCRTDKVCEEVKQGDAIDASSREHVERNSCNRCPSSFPSPMGRVVPKHGHNPEQTVLSHFEDSEGNHWLPDSLFTAPRFHGDAGIGARDAPNLTETY